MQKIFNNGAESASTRIRGIAFTQGIDADVLYIQKRADGKAIDAAMESKIPVIYDLDDTVRQKENKWRVTMLMLAGVVTTDTGLRADVLREYTKNDVVVVPDCIDYIDSPPKPIPPRKIKNIVTFGNKLSVRNAEGWATHHISSERMIKGTFIKWNLDSFVKTLRSFDLCVLRNVNKTAVKSNIRLITAMSLGLPCVVSDTPAYAETMRMAGFPGLITDDIAELPDIIDYIESVPDISKAFIDFAWKHYSPEASRKTFRNVCERICNGISIQSGR